MRKLPLILIIPMCMAVSGLGVSGQSEGDDPVKALVGRLDLEKYKATIKGLTQFGDRRQGTDRNRAAVDWIEAQLESYGCPTERIKYEHNPAPNTGGGRGRGNTGRAQGGGRPRGVKTPTGVNTDPMKQPDEKLRALNTQPTTPGPREAVFCIRSARQVPRRCTSSVATWTDTDGARRRMTMDPARRW